MRFGPPQIPMIRYIGMSVASKKMKNNIASSAANTPIITPDNTRKAPMYWCTRSVIDSQLATTTITVMNAVSGMSHREMPSTPRW